MEDLGFPPGLPAFYKDRIENTQTYKVLFAWHAHFGLSMTPHLLCYVMQRPWSEVRAELNRTYEGGRGFRVVNCPDINDIAYYVDYPVDSGAWDRTNYIVRYPQYLEYSDKKIAAYPPEEGFVNAWNGEGLKELKFRDRAFHMFGYKRSEENSQKIVETLRAACHVK
jgi:hypothetical protein